MKKPTFMNKFILFFILTIVLFALVISAYLYLFIAPRLFENEQSNKVKLLETEGSSIETFVKTKVLEIEKIKDVVSNLDTQEDIKKYIDNQQEIQSEIKELYIYNKDGLSYGSTNITGEEIDAHSVLEKTIIFEKSINEKHSNIYIISSWKSKDKTWCITGMLDLALYLDRLNLNKNLIIFNDNSKVVAVNGGDEQDLEIIDSQYQFVNRPIVEYLDKNKTSKIATIANIDSLGWVLISSLPKNEFYHNGWSTIYNFILLGVIVCILCIIAVGVMYKFLMQSVSRLVNGVQAVEKGDLSFKISNSKRDILNGVVDGFNKMVQKLRENYQELQKQTEELYERNWQIEESNRELEDSYEKLQETINQLNEAEEKYYSLVKNIPEIVCVVDNDGIITFINDMVSDILGYNKAEIIGKNIDVIIEHQLAEKFLSIMNKRLKRTNKVIFELPMVRKDGRSIICEAKVTYYLRNGNIDGIQAIVRDITKSKKMQKEIIHKNEELLTIYNISKSLSSTIELDNVFELIVNEVCKILNAEMCILRLYDAGEKDLILKAYSGNFFEGVSEDELSQFTIMKEQRAGADLSHEKGIAFINTFEQDWIVTHINNRKQEQDRINEITLVPICAKDKVLGAIAVGTKNRINEKHLNILKAITNNAAVAIENATLYENSKKYFIKTIDALIAAVEAKDKYTEGHSRRVSRYVDIIGTALDLQKEKLDDLKIAGILHDVGKIGISDNILLKPGRLTQEEYEEVKQHPIISNRILYSVGLSEITMKAIACHHERYDGKGYPFGLKEDELSIECQIIAVADAFDAMTSNRAYRQALSIDEAINEIIANRGTQFGPSVVDALIELYKNNYDVILEATNDTEIA